MTSQTKLPTALYAAAGAADLAREQLEKIPTRAVQLSEQVKEVKLRDKALDLGMPEPVETYSSSPHLYEELNIPEGATGTVRKARTAATGEAADGEAAEGEELFVTRGCGACHTIDGLEGAAGKVGPDLTHLQSRDWFAGATFELNERNLRRWLRNPPEMKPMRPENNQGMPDLGLSEEEITKLIAYLETLK